MKHVSEDQILSAVPLLPEMTRRQKLERWADLVQNQQEAYVNTLHNLEHWKGIQLELPLHEVTYRTNTLFHIACEDHIFKRLGLQDNVSSLMRFFEITQDQLHEFSCDCSGLMSARTVARKIRNIANPTWSGWVINLFR